MKNKKVTDCCKNAVGTMFLLAGTFFVCSTLLSMRAVFADPIAPAGAGNTVMGPQSARAGNNSRTNRASPRNTQSRTTNVARTTVSRGNVGTASRGVATRGTASRGTTTTNTVRTAVNNTSTGRSNTSTGRNVVSRSGAVRTVASNNNASNRRIVARTGMVGTPTSSSRVSLQGSAIRGNTGSNSGTTYTYLTNKLYTGNYSNIIDSTTGLISADAYQTCVEAYYTCMDEICTARSEAQGRCACAGRTRAFATAEKALEVANEELIKVSGELALLVATKGKDVSAAFQLTDAEKVMNCVSWQEMSSAYKAGYRYIEEGKYSKSGTVDAATYWCTSHGIYDSSCSGTTAPTYCSDTGNNFGFDINQIEGSSSDILASLKSWADAKENAVSILTNNDEDLLSKYTNVLNASYDLNLVADTSTSSSIQDKLLNTWGYDLFAYGHNNVCGRVLDSCFNGIFEACGTPPKNGRCVNSATSSCPYNYNSYVEVSSDGNVTLNERSKTGTISSTNGTCYGYSSTTGDPYGSLRGPVADARRSIMNKYLLDANAACDVYGEKLRTAAQNIGYQKVAAQQALQQKRMEFANEEADAIISDYRTARSNFNECLSELYDCYTTQATAYSNWSTSRIKTYCAQVSNVPHCYETMVCDAPNNKLAAVIEQDADGTCNNSTEYKSNNCRNIITLAEILSGSFADGKISTSSAKMREECMQRLNIDSVRNWNRNDKPDYEWPDSATDCGTNKHLENGTCQLNTTSCTVENAVNATKTWNATTSVWGDCIVSACVSNYTISADQKSCGQNPGEDIEEQPSAAEPEDEGEDAASEDTPGEGEEGTPGEDAAEE